MSLASLYRLALLLHSGVPYRLFRGGYAFPTIHYYLEVTRRCNLRCRMCQYIEWLKEALPEEQKRGELSTEEWKRVIDQTGRFSLVTFTGGEPWVRSDFLDLLEYACARRMTHCISNCTLLNAARARRCVELAAKRFGGRGLMSLGVSLDAPGAVHDTIRGLDGAFDRVTETISNLTHYRTERGQRWPMVHVTTVIQEANVDVLHEMPRVARDIGADVLNLTLEIRFHDFRRLGDVDPSAIRASDIRLPRIERARLEGALHKTLDAAQSAGIEVRLPRMPLDQVVEYYAGDQDLGQFECRTPWTTLFIGCKGDVFPCFIYKAGDIRRESIKAIWNGARMRAFRKRCRKGLWPVCKGCCEMNYRANGN
ncbi:MAG TPA: radical SAM protein [Candidatus Hydrogenedentes bacterium]|nr:radical SAM protein [Candidatus Hydrogenedentota bacterium]HPG68099.1 radical SAM protein [Candidatus Hydrogenedentota bacterium]